MDNVGREKSQNYVETSLARCAYLVAIGHKPLAVEWGRAKDGSPSAAFLFKPGNKLGMDVLKWKGSSANALLDCFSYLSGQVAKYKRGVERLNPYREDIAANLRDWTPKY